MNALLILGLVGVLIFLSVSGDGKKGSKGNSNNSKKKSDSSRGCQGVGQPCNLTLALQNLGNRVENLSNALTALCCEGATCVGNGPTDVLGVRGFAADDVNGTCVASGNNVTSVLSILPNNVTKVIPPGVTALNPLNVQNVPGQVLTGTLGQVDNVVP